MKHALIAAVAVAALAVGASNSSFAQSAGVQVGPIAAGINLEPAQRTRIKEYVVREKVAPVKVKDRIAVGTKLPADVQLRSVPADWGPSVSKYRYVYSDNNVYFVEPSNRTVVHVLD